MTRHDPSTDFSVPAGFADAVMGRVAASPAPMPVRTFWAAVLDRSAFDVLGSLAVAWRLVARGSAVPAMVRAQALALIVLVAASLLGGTTIAAAAAYRTVAPILSHETPIELLTQASPTDRPDTTRHDTPIVVAVPDRPDGKGVDRTVAASVTHPTQDPADRTSDAPGRDRSPKAEDEQDKGAGGDGSTSGRHDGDPSDDGDGKTDGSSGAGSSGGGDDGSDAPDGADGADGSAGSGHGDGGGDGGGD